MESAAGGPNQFFFESEAFLNEGVSERIRKVHGQKAVHIPDVVARFGGGHLARFQAKTGAEVERIVGILNVGSADPFLRQSGRHVADLAEGCPLDLLESDPDSDMAVRIIYVVLEGPSLGIQIGIKKNMTDVGIPTEGDTDRAAIVVGLP